MFLADNHGFGMFSQRIDQNVRMGGNNELSAFSGCDQQISYLGKNVGMQTKLRFFDANDWRRFRIAQDSQETEIANGSIRQPGGWDGKLAFGEKDLDGTSLNAHVEVVKTLI